MAVFRIERTRDYTVMSNHHLRDKALSLKSKYDITQHPNYKYTADADPKNAFDIEGYLKARLKLKPNQVCDVYEIDAAAGE